jgi:N-methylhydantoinase A
LPPYRLGIDIGGTFTDFSLLDEASGVLTGFKSPTVPSDPARGLLEGLRTLIAEQGLEPTQIGYLVHGSTIAINTVIQRNGAQLGFLATRGFADILELQRLRLDAPVNFSANRPLPLIPRYRVGQVTERIMSDGSVDTPLDVEDLLNEARRLIEHEQVEGLVVCFLNAYRAPRHEVEAKRILNELYPDLPLTCSFEVWPQIREYERAIVTILNAYVRPNVVRYLQKLENELSNVGVHVPLYITKSNGGVTTARDARQATAETLLSGPASGVIGASYVCRRAGYDNLITLDMGGTSADIALVRGGQPLYSTDEHVGDFPVVMPVVGVSSIGAGGGSIAWIDQAGVLKVGPRSAGADPGPACYGRGGIEPALSDAFLVCGFLNPDNFVGGRMRLDHQRAVEALQPLAASLELTVDALAEGIVEVATANMYLEFSNVLSRHGVDPRDFSLVPFGGAGAIQACFLAQEFHIPQVVVPPAPGTLCALGAMTADVKSDYIKTIHRKIGGKHAEGGAARQRSQADADQVTAREIASACDELRARALRWLEQDAPAVASSAIDFSGDMRYVGQSFQIEVPIDPGWLEDESLSELIRAFHERHDRLYAHADLTAEIELIDLRATISGTMPKPELSRPPSGSGVASPYACRPIHYRGQRFEAGVYHRRDLLAGQQMNGPAVVEQEDTTILIPDDFVSTVDDFGNLVIREA